MRRALVGILSAGALAMTAVAAPASAAPKERACAKGKHGTEHAHETVPERNHQAHRSIPHHCSGHGH